MSLEIRGHFTAMKGVYGMAFRIGPWNAANVLCWFTLARMLGRQKCHLIYG